MLANKSGKFTIIYWRYNTIWFDEISKEKFHHQNFKEEKNLPPNFHEIEYAILWYYKLTNGSFISYPDLDKLLYLELNWANISNFQDIKKFTGLKRLELNYCIKLDADTGLEHLTETLEFLHINQSKKFVPADGLFKLKRLKVLRLNSCGPINDLGFLKFFPELIDFRFVDTNISDGNLNPILEHPTIRSVGFLNKRHYNFKDEQLKTELALKSPKENITYAYKGAFETFRYDHD